MCVIIILDCIFGSRSLCMLKSGKKNLKNRLRDTYKWKKIKTT